ncbi:glucodextranase-like protein [Halanaerobium saccharolyticum]|uniref:Glucodextranase-like protein n=1 Tax=Halanaerobium saccharolyticum TaxID=43595 RepID=A0A4R6M012_9FIRM|nr:glucodextranase DOMON-like domain-containing protein [Halanaerobium saccharolyticum]TDO94501.1 glucodextranase-like protein [Halanaerobium saccharolyticum]
MALKKIKNKRQKLVILFIICLFILPAAASAKNYRVIFNHLDGIGDDYGPGNYDYPQYHIFQNKGHLFDLRSMTIYEAEAEYKIRFAFTNLTDPWGAKYGFSLPLIEIYIDHQNGGSSQLFQEGANVRFKEDFKWNKLIKISGWWVRLFNPDSKQENLLNINELSLSNPVSNGDLSLRRKDNNLFLKIPKSVIDSLQQSKIIVMVGSFDPFGYDHFRSISKSRSSWQVYSKSNISNSKSTRVLDLLVPGGRSQKKILRGELPALPYLKIGNERPARQPTLVDQLQPLNKISLSILFLYILILIFVLYKFNYNK